MKAKVIVITKEVYGGTCHRLSLGNIVYVTDEDNFYHELLLDSNKIIHSSRIIPKSHCEVIRDVELSVRAATEVVYTLVELPIPVKKYKVLFIANADFNISRDYYISLEEFNDMHGLCGIYLIKESEKEF